MKPTPDQETDHRSHTYTTIEAVRDAIANMIMEGRIVDEGGIRRGSIGHALTEVPLHEIAKAAGLE